MKTAFCFDLDGTLSTMEILPCIAAELGVADEIATLTRLTIDGHIPFADSLRLRSVILGQVELARVHEIIAAVPLAIPIIDFISRRSDRCYVMTGNLDIWIAPLRSAIPCAWRTSRARFESGRIRLEHILDKGRAIQELRAEKQFGQIVAVGDGANDEGMLREADVAIAYGGVHRPANEALMAAGLVVNDADTLCSLLKAL